ncbi:MAG: hypothetical protein AAF376_03855 [Pseudomonadota bacterium]
MKPIILALLPLPALADPASIVGVEAVQSGEAWRFEVTIEHGDTGWDDYADGWRVELADGTVLATRTLFHPHVEEQPFTRSQSGIDIPDGVTEVQVRASTNVEGWADTTEAFQLPR